MNRRANKSDKVWGWAIAFLLVDLLGYVGHRMMHEVNFLWALHEGHHSSEAFNLGMGPRQSFFVGLAQPVFVLPLALVVPVEMLVTLQAFELLWALLLHTPYVGKLGWLEERGRSASLWHHDHAPRTRDVASEYPSLATVVAHVARNPAALGQAWPVATPP